MNEIKIEQFNDFLKSAGILPVIEKWNSFKIVHPAIQPDKISEKMQIENIKIQVESKEGLYCYYNAVGECLYVGKAKPLFNRIKSHYRESFTPNTGKGKEWNEFFNLHAGELTVYWLELNTEDIRVIIERLVATYVNPIFESITPRKR